ncbi:MarR family transcriptional regulator [Kribbella pittospori]|uniref:MarR family transcriptional regulator n=2 Tax=Kribbella TaxID=182639 RepID=A0A4R0JGP4_9ACTN|nr:MULTISPECIES: MarR family transcriptional regulator [Kribbella]TCC43866.1 MarR family transcriptional regulator [Kribbella capetownensis]TCC64673.1 MarR family transcriptional regulator [Kribbella pittospori]WSY21490.1 MarR family transcriptional regulator [Kribbella sp. NBC_00889]
MAEPRWLNQTEQQAWRAFIAAQRVVNTRIEQQLQRDAGIPHTYYEILVRLSDAPDGRLRMSELAVATLGSRSRLSHAVNRLEQTGWVRREAIESDRRGQVAIITDLGRQKLVETAPGHVEEVRKSIFDALSEEQVEHLYDLCATLARHSGDTVDRAAWERR